MFYSDKPILNADGDSLNRNAFALQLAKAILSYTKIDNFTVSLCGKWGTGKTSILNMVVEKIEELAKEKSSDERPIIVHFNPWNYSDTTQLLNQFFQTIRTQIGLSDNRDNLGGIGAALKKYSSLIEYTTYIPKIGPFLGPLKSLIEGFGEHLEEIADESNGLSYQKKKVIEELEKQSQKIIVIIDDIDRLNNEQIRLIFQLVNSLAGFPNMIYLLSFDRSVVVRALEAEQDCDGEEYLEKIIQVIFEVPTANKILINKMFIDSYSKIVLDGLNPNLSFNNDYWDNVFQFCISPFIKTIRDVKRIINTFEFKYELVRDETNCIDLLALTTLQVCAPDIYNWIQTKIDDLTGSIGNLRSISLEEQMKKRSHCLEIFKEIYPNAPDVMLQVIQTLFPKFSWDTNGYFTDSDSEPELRRKYRIASKDRSKRYFYLALEDTELSAQDVRNTVFNFSREELNSFFIMIEESEKLHFYLDEFLAYLPELSLERRHIFLDKLIKYQSNEKYKIRKNMLEATVAQKSNICVRAIFQSGNSRDNFDFLRDLIENSSIDELPVICEIITRIEYAYGKNGSSIDSRNQYVTEDCLCELEEALILKINQLTEEHCILDCNPFEDIGIFWSYKDKDSWNKYIENQLKIDENVPKYLSIYAGTWSAGKVKGWSFKEGVISDFLDDEEIYRAIINIKNTEKFSSLSYNFKQIAVAFSIWYKQEVKNHHEISREIVDSIIPEWEKSKDSSCVKEC